MKNSIYFKEALKLAEMVKGRTSPNPAVGCVIVKDDLIVGKGSTQPPGLDHAEIAALKESGNKAFQASMYVTLEPCVYYQDKRTASCSDAIIEAGVSEIYIGMKDPNPKVNGEGIGQLKAAGIKVHLLHEVFPEIFHLNEDFFKYIQTGIPFVYAKYAMTLDGNIADRQGDSKWITGPESREWVHRLRNRVDGIMVGVGTVLKDNPELNVRIPEKFKNPLRIIVNLVRLFSIK